MRGAGGGHVFRTVGTLCPRAPGWKELYVFKKLAHGRQGERSREGGVGGGQNLEHIGSCGLR